MLWFVLALLPSQFEVEAVLFLFDRLLTKCFCSCHESFSWQRQGDHLVQRPDHLVQRRYQIARPPGAKTLPDHLVQRPYLLVHAKQPSSMHKENPAGGRVGTMKERVITCQCCYNNAITCQCCYNKRGQAVPCLQTFPWPQILKFSM